MQIRILGADGEELERTIGFRREYRPVRHPKAAAGASAIAGERIWPENDALIDCHAPKKAA